MILYSLYEAFRGDLSPHFDGSTGARVEKGPDAILQAAESVYSLLKPEEVEAGARVYIEAIRKLYRQHQR